MHPILPFQTSKMVLDHNIRDSVVTGCLNWKAGWIRLERTVLGQRLQDWGSPRPTVYVFFLFTQAWVCFSSALYHLCSGSRPKTRGPAYRSPDLQAKQVKGSVQMIVSWEEILSEGRSNLCFGQVQNLTQWSKYAFKDKTWWWRKLGKADCRAHPREFICFHAELEICWPSYFCQKNLKTDAYLCSVPLAKPGSQTGIGSHDL